MGDLARRVLLMEENAVKYEERLAGSVTNLGRTSLVADRSLKAEHEEQQLYSKLAEENENLEQQLKEAQEHLTGGYGIYISFH